MVSRAVFVLFLGAALFVPLYAAQAFSLPGFGIGGTVKDVTVCASPPGAILVSIKTPNRGLAHYLWTPGIPYLHPGPPRPEQNILALVAPTPIPCFGLGIGKPKLGAGFPILFLLHGSSKF